MLILKSLRFQSFVLLTFRPGTWIFFLYRIGIDYFLSMTFLSLYRISGWSYVVFYHSLFLSFPFHFCLFDSWCADIYCDFYYKLIRSHKLFCSTWISSIQFFNISCHKRFCMCLLCFMFHSVESFFFLFCRMPLFCMAFLDNSKHNWKTFQSQFLAVCRTKDAYFMISHKSKLAHTKKLTTGCRLSNKAHSNSNLQNIIMEYELLIFDSINHAFVEHLRDIRSKFIGRALNIYKNSHRKKDTFASMVK